MYEKQRYVLDKLIRKAGIKPYIHKVDVWFVAGGALTSVFLNTTVIDLDIFFIHEDHYNEFKRAHNHSFNRKNLICQTDCADSYNINGIRVQLIKRIYGKPCEVIGRFDYTICMAAYLPMSGEIILGNNFLYHLSGKELHYHIGEYPLASLWRAKKYLKKGFNFPAVEIIKLALTINNLNIKDYKELKEQLEGIDTLFLMDLTNALLKQGKKEFEFKKALVFMENVLAKKLKMEWEGE